MVYGFIEISTWNSLRVIQQDSSQIFKTLKNENLKI
jgi:hypothetical protein